MDNPLQSLRDSLSAAVCAVAGDLRSDVAQDALDVLAVAAGWKPVAIVGCGYDASGFGEAVRAAARPAGLEVAEGKLWREIGEARGLPPWYADSLAAMIAGVRVLFVGNQSLQDIPGCLLTATEEAALLGYPTCCVVEYHRRRRLYHLLAIRAIRRQAEGDVERMRQLADSQVMLTPRSQRERRQFARALRGIFLPYASVAICEICETEPNSPARKLGERYRGLIAEAGLEGLANLVDPA
jgi:hypothetical protein